MYNEQKMTPRRFVAVVVGAILLVLSPIIFMMSFETLNADQILVVQDPIDGDLHWYTSAGLKPQWFGKVTIYKKRSIYPFEARIRFNEGGHAVLNGSMQWEMPLSTEHLTELHTRFGSNDAIAKQLIEVVTDKSIYMSGPLLSSTESYAEKRPNLIFWVEDQIVGGVYKTTRRDIKVHDPITGEDKTVTVAEIALDTLNNPLRQEDGQLEQFGIRPFNFAVTEITYEDKVEAQIQLQQDNIMAVQTAMAQARKAEQEALTVEQQGRAEAAKQRWEQEAIKAKAVTAAQQQLEVARLQAAAAEQTRIEQIRLGEGEARRRQLVMQADGALKMKLDAWLEAQKLWASSVSQYGGSWVPSIVMGQQGSNGASASGAMDLVNLLTAKTALDLQLNLSPNPNKK